MKKLLAILAVIFTAQLLSAQVSILALDTPVTENFDGMGASGTTFLSGWTSTDPSMAVTDGNSTSGSVYNVGTTSASDRAFGSLASGSVAPIIGAQFQNNSGSTVSSLAISGVCEQWRSATINTVNEVLPFEYSLDATSLTTGTWTAVSALNLVEILTSSTTGAATDGNNVANRVSISGSITGIVWAAGATLWIRWSDTNDSGSDGLYAIDDFSITASGVPPASDGDGFATLSNQVGGVLNGTNIFSEAVNANMSITVTGVETGTLTSVRVVIPADWSEGISSGDVTLSGDGFAGATKSVVGTVITVTNAMVTDTDLGVITISGSSVVTPDVSSNVINDGVYTFSVETAIAAGTLTTIENSPDAYLIIPIANIRDVDANGVPLDLGETFVVEGTANVANGRWSNTDLDITIQDANSGMSVFLSGGAANSITVGNKYIVKGLLEQTNAKSRLKITGFSDVISNGTGSLPSIMDNSNIYAISDLSDETKEGIRVTIKNAAVTGTWPTSSTSFTNLTIDDGTGTMTLRANRTTVGFTDLSGQTFDIVGVLLQFDSSSPFTSGYQIYTRDSSDFYPANTLPVELSSFSVANFADGVKLTWSTKSEQNNYGFEVEKKANGTWSKVGFVAGKGTTNDAQTYSFVDSNVSGKVYYRLKQVDFDGAFEYSAEVEFVGTPSTFEVIGNYPNPFNPATVIKFNLPAEMQVTVSVFNVLGQRVAELVNGKLTAGEKSVSFNAAGLSSGVYIYRIQAGNQTVTRSMLLTK